ncbi:Piso0_004534 [Millerozyma farinosa CBS 7064]|uniref:Piso0_004534 protein n=1 Tax=Pichia sorbitophila (strain ATCC MYA-4447 / BCRC 22081 / CBS 7064 / NBRC 10061 / NRRL Y-12695) TaxID=559304 RepID=G8Y923_PICSO|nr:Piso0_004534 [Millerozyma farinosa CBS 7064]CCE84968.1 Piso0_004534 [Millerozyma farinosa CBS 7064]
MDPEQHLKGYVSTIPLTIEDKETGDIIKRSTLFVLSKHTNAVDDNSISIKLTTIIEEGTYCKEINDENYLESRRRGTYDNESWCRVLKYMFPDVGQLPASKAGLTLSARLPSLSQYYSRVDKRLLDLEDITSVSDILTIYVNTSDRIPITEGVLEIPYVDLNTESEDAANAELNLFHWMGLLSKQNEALLSELSKRQQESRALREEANAYKSQLDLSLQRHQDIVNDIQSKMYLVLNAKKARINELEDMIAHGSKSGFGVPQSRRVPDNSQGTEKSDSGDPRSATASSSAVGSPVASPGKPIVSSPNRQPDPSEPEGGIRPQLGTKRMYPDAAKIDSEDSPNDTDISESSAGPANEEDNTNSPASDSTFIEESSHSES